MRENSPCEFTPCELGVCCLHLYLFLADTPFSPGAPWAPPCRQTLDMRGAQWLSLSRTAALITGYVLAQDFWL